MDATLENIIDLYLKAAEELAPENPEIPLTREDILYQTIQSEPDDLDSFVTMYSKPNNNFGAPRTLVLSYSLRRGYPKNESPTDYSKPIDLVVYEGDLTGIDSPSEALGKAIFMRPEKRVDFSFPVDGSRGLHMLLSSREPGKEVFLKSVFKRIVQLYLHS